MIYMRAPVHQYSEYASVSTSNGRAYVAQFLQRRGIGLPWDGAVHSSSDELDNLLSAIERENLVTVRVLLSQKPDLVNQVHPLKGTPAMCALFKKKLRTGFTIIKLILVNL